MLHYAQAPEQVIGEAARVTAADGRVLAISNAAFKGTQNRLIVIDEVRRTARWVVDSARDFVRIPGTQELLVKIIVGQLGYDIRRVPIPAASGAAP